MKQFVIFLFVVQSFFVVTEIGCDENNKLKYIRKMLKEYALCQCISYGNKVEDDQIYDGSTGRLMRLLHLDYYVYRKLDSVIENIYKNSSLEGTVEDFKVKYYYYRCIKFYEGAFLDSLVNFFDDNITIDVYELKKLKSQYQYDSIYIKELIIDSQQEKKDE